MDNALTLWKLQHCALGLECEQIEPQLIGEQCPAMAGSRGLRGRR